MKKLFLTLTLATSLSNSAFGAAAAAASAADLDPTPHSTSAAAATAITADDAEWLNSGIVARTLSGGLTSDDLQKLESIFGINTSNDAARALLIFSNPLIKFTEEDEKNFYNHVFPEWFVEYIGFLPNQDTLLYSDTEMCLNWAIEAVRETEPHTALQLIQALEKVTRLSIESRFNYENEEIERFLSLVKVIDIGRPFSFVQLSKHFSNIEALMNCILYDFLNDSGVTNSFLPEEVRDLYEQVIALKEQLRVLKEQAPATPSSSSSMFW